MLGWGCRCVAMAAGWPQARALARHALPPPALAPSGAVFLFCKAHQALGDPAFWAAAQRAGEAVWQRGLLTKGPGACHGVSCGAERGGRPPRASPAAPSFVFPHHCPPRSASPHALPVYPGERQRICSAAPAPQRTRRRRPRQVAAPRYTVCAVHGQVRAGQPLPATAACCCTLAKRGYCSSSGSSCCSRPSRPCLERSPPAHLPLPAPSSCAAPASPTTRCRCTRAALRRRACGRTCWVTLGPPPSQCLRPATCDRRLFAGSPSRSGALCWQPMFCKVSACHHRSPAWHLVAESAAPMLAV